jgi:hypothetical protein
MMMMMMVMMMTMDDVSSWVCRVEFLVSWLQVVGVNVGVLVLVSLVLVGLVLVGLVLVAVAIVVDFVVTAATVRVVAARSVLFFFVVMVVVVVVMVMMVRLMPRGVRTLIRAELRVRVQRGRSLPRRDPGRPTPHQIEI